MLSKEEAWPKVVVPEAREGGAGLSMASAGEGDEAEDEPLVVEVPRRRASEGQLSEAMSVLRARADSLGATRQPMAKGGHA